MLKVVSGIGTANRALLAELHREREGLFTVSDAAGVWGMDPTRTRRRLAYFVDHGWLTRIRPGFYITVPLEASVPDDWHEDPWIIASRLFAPCYIGGWSACEHWGFTDQIFRDIVVVTTKKIRYRRPCIQGTVFWINSIAQRKLFGTVNVWRRGVKTVVSDPSRTVADVLAHPALGGGIVHVAEVLRSYWETDYRNEMLLLEYMDKLQIGSAAKRLGYLLETLDLHSVRLIRECLKRRTHGVILLDPKLPRSGPIVSRWGLRANVASLVPKHGELM